MTIHKKKRDIESLVSDLLEVKAGEITVKARARVGGDSEIFDISVGNRNYVLRTGGFRSNYDLEHKVLKKVRSKGVLAPKPVACSVDKTKYPFTFSLQEKVPGQSLEALPETLWPEVLTEVGENLARMHAIPISGFGELDPIRFRQNGELRGKEKTWYSYLSSRFDLMASVEEKLSREREEKFKNSKLSKAQVEKTASVVGRLGEVNRWLEQAKRRLEQVEGFLIHHDISLGHILVDNGKLSAIIDFNHIASGDPLYDIAYFSVMPHGEETYKYLLKGSEIKMNQEFFNLYRLIIAVGKIHTRYVRHDYLHDYPEILDIALKELNKRK